MPGRVVKPDGVEILTAEGQVLTVNPESGCYIVSPEYTLGRFDFFSKANRFLYSILRVKIKKICCLPDNVVLNYNFL